jgi:ADP-ribose pyrophosphatase YjhB (NUDIX family)
VGVGGIVGDGAGRVLLVQRGKEPGFGLWAFPGGHLEWGEALRQGAEREVWEECGIRVKAGPLLYVSEMAGQAFHFIVLDYACRWDGSPVRPGEDAADAAWFARDDAFALPLTDSMRPCLENRGVMEFLGWA